MTSVVVVGSEAEAGVLAAESILLLIIRKPDAVLGLATGSTPLPVYHALTELLARDRVDVSRVFETKRRMLACHLSQRNRLLRQYGMSAPQRQATGLPPALRAVIFMPDLTSSPFQCAFSPLGRSARGPAASAVPGAGAPSSRSASRFASGVNRHHNSRPRRKQS